MLYAVIGLLTEYYYQAKNPIFPAFFLKNMRICYLHLFFSMLDSTRSLYLSW